MASTSTARLTCLCGYISAAGSLLAEAQFPTSSEMCHCSSCRHLTGSLGATFPLLKSAPSPDTIARLTVYKSSPRAFRYFCPTCGCHCFFYNVQKQQWFCLGGIIESGASGKEQDALSTQDTVRIVHHEYVGDTIDGGLVPYLLKLGGRSIPICAAGRQGGHQTPDRPLVTLPQVLPSTAVSASAPPRASRYLEAKCHCGGVRLLIKRANFLPSPDPATQARFVPRDPTKYLTYMCACRSCRLSSGVSLVPWTTVPPSSVFNGNAPRTTDSADSYSPLAFGHQASDPASNPALALRHHWSSSDVSRSFCGTCGSSVSYWCAQRPDELDVVVGILRSEDGSMAQKWLEWDWGRCSFPDEATDKELLDGWQKSADMMKTRAAGVS